MLIHLPYGETGLPVTLDDGWDVNIIEPAFTRGLDDPAAALRSALRQPFDSGPLAELVKPEARVGIIFNDITRATPTSLLIQGILTEMSGVPDDHITLFNATGTHRPNTEAELRTLLGDEFYRRFKIVQNDARDASTQVCLGKTGRGHPIWINRELVGCDVRILTGFIEPHFFAGFSGGGKAIMPGMAGMPTILANHGAEMIADPHSTWGVTAGNPIAEEVMEIAQQVGVDFIVNVVMNRRKEITGIFAGGLEEAHRRGCQFARQTAMAPVAAPFDIVLTTNSGYPLDQNLYQSVKGISAAAQIVKPGGAILIAAECRDGIPDYGEYGALLKEAGSPQRVLEQVLSPGFCRPDQWQAQIQAQIQLRTEVYVYSHRLSRAQIEAALFKPVESVEAALQRLTARYGPHARIAVLPEGPQTIPYITVCPG
jgi:nickel-dependent lactate racemase